MGYLFPYELRKVGMIPATITALGLFIFSGILIFTSFTSSRASTINTFVSAVFALIGLWVLFSSKKMYWVQDLTYYCDGTTISNVSVKRVNTIELQQQHYLYHVIIPFYLAKSKLNMQYCVYSVDELDCDTLIGSGGSQALIRFHLSGAILLPDLIVPY